MSVSSEPSCGYSVGSRSCSPAMPHMKVPSKREKLESGQVAVDLPRGDRGMPVEKLFALGLGVIRSDPGPGGIKCTGNHRIGVQLVRRMHQRRRQVTRTL